MPLFHSDFAVSPAAYSETFCWCLLIKWSTVGERGKIEIERGRLKITLKLKLLLPNPRVGCCLHEI